ncbi:AMP-binding protein [Malikia sp.]|uniref:AMP-binding protein n=1 Tax=Malikia sp. TaxID=2070706 RepID=UPI0026041E1D|nr:AMP-binding protein [Malikia sp.]MDD2730041.1 AMP-binding protein [Malikia sp.]
MNQNASNLKVDDTLNPTTLGRIRHWTSVRPQQLALLHKRRGRWVAWSWAEVEIDVARLASVLRHQGFDSRSTLAVSGPFEPTLIMLALAAYQLGGEVVTISRLANAEQLNQVIDQAQPTHAYVHGRDGMARWIKAAASGRHELLLISNQAAARQVNHWHLVPLESGFPAQQVAAPRRVAATARRSAGTLWSEEGTESSLTLPHLLNYWLEKGETFAFPETIGSAARDRRDVAPSSLLLSEDRLRALADEIENRLAAPGSLPHRIWEWTLADHSRGIRRHIRAKVRRLFGLQRLQNLMAGAESPRSIPAVAALLGTGLEKTA